MSGQAGGRGYLLQTMICVLDSLDDPHWLRVAIEPNDQSEKVDIVWEYEDRNRAVQVKSSQNQIDLPSARRWASELESSSDADELELRLIGPCSEAVSNVGQIGAVDVPTPDSVNVQALNDQAAHRLDRYLASGESPTQLGPFAREVVVGALSHRFATFSTKGQPVSRDNFDALLRSWIASIQPPVTPFRPIRAEVKLVRQLSAPPRDFVGRGQELEKLSDAIKSGARLVGIRGMPGVGKSAFAAKLATAVAHLFTGWHIQLDLRGHSSRPVTKLEAMRHVIQVAEPSAAIPTDEQALEGLYRSTLRRADAILFLENVPDAETLTDLDPRSESLVVFTSRKRFVTPSLTYVDLLPLGTGPASELLLGIAPRMGDRARAVAALCGCLPLAIRVAACSFAERPDIGIDDFIDRLTEKRAILEFVEASIQLSYELLDDKQRSWICQMSLFPADFDTQSCAAICSLDKGAADTAIASLLRQSLVEWDESTGRYWMHELIAAFAADRSGETELNEAKWRFCEYFRNVSFDIEETYKRGHDEVLEALFRFDCERPNLEVAVNWLTWRSSDDQKAAQLCVDYVSSTVFPRDLRQHPIERIRWLSMGFEAAQRVPDGISALSFLGNIGRAWADLGEIEKALEIHQQSLDAARQFKLRPHQCVGHLQVGNMQSLLGDFRKAQENFDASYEIAVETGNRSLEGHALANAGYAHFKRCEFDAANDKLTRGSQVFADLGDQLNLAKTLSHMSEVASSAGEHALAIDMCEQSVGLAEELEDPLSVVQIGRQYGEVLCAGGDFNRAVSVLEQNVEFAKQIGLARFVFAGLRKLAIAHERAESPDLADAVLDEYDVAAESIGNDRTRLAGQRTRASILELRGDFSAAITILEEELKVVRRETDFDAELSVLCRLSKLHKLDGDRQNETVTLERVCEIAAQIEHPLVDEFRKTLAGLH